MANYIHHTAASRGHFDHGWLKTWHSFSFASYFDRNRMNFGALRVLNDDIVAGGAGFDFHPHDNMEIITIPLQGALEHKDSMGNGEIIHRHEIQVMSAGTGILHSEFNPDPDQEVRLLQIWVFPGKQNLKPRYDQQRFDPVDRINKFQIVVQPGPAPEGLWIHQDAWFSLGEFDRDFDTSYAVKKAGNGIYVFMIEGSAVVDDILLETRDGLGITGTPKIRITTKAKAEILIMEIPPEHKK